MNNFFHNRTAVFIIAMITLFTGCATHNGMVSDSNTPGMTKIFYQIDIDAPKLRVWKVLADFENLRWSETVTDVHFIGDTRAGVGMTRHCDLKDDGYIVERIIEWKQGSGFTYTI